MTAIALLWAATALGAGMVFLTQTLLARELGPAAYGLFASSLATVSMIAPLAGFGLSQFWLKAYGVEGWSADRWLSPSLRFTSITTALAIAMILGWSLTGAPADGTRRTLLLLLPVVLSVLCVDLVGSKLRLEERYAALALWQLAIPGSRLLVAVVLLLVPTLAWHFVAFGYGLISLIVAVAAVGPLSAMLHGRLRLHGHGERPVGAPGTSLPTVREIFSRAWAYGLSAVLYPIFFQISTVLLKYIGGDAQAGRFGIALAVMTAIYLIPSTVYQKFLLSKLNRWAAHDRQKFRFVYSKGIVLMLAAGLVIGLLLAASAPVAVPLAFGERYRLVSPILVVLSACPPMRFLSTAIGAALLTERHMRYRVIAMASAAVVVVVLSACSIPYFGEMGAAYSTVAGEAVLLAAMSAGVRRLRAGGGISADDE